MAKDIQEVLDLASELRSSKVAPQEADALEVDPLFYEDPRLKKVAEFSLKRRKNLLVKGDSGCGKSHGLINIAARHKEQMEVVNLNGEASVDAIMGKLLITPTDKGEAVTSEAPGPLMRAYEFGRILLLEEVDHALADVLAVLHRPMESQSKFLSVDIGSHRVIKKHPKFMVWATANTTGWGEGAFLYAGTKPMNQAFMNRFSLTMKMDYLPPEQEAKVVSSKTGIDPATATRLVEVAVEIRSSRESATERVVSLISTRDLLEWADVMEGMGANALEAAEVTFLERMMDTDQGIVRKLITNHF